MMTCWCPVCQSLIGYEEEDMRMGGNPFAWELEFYIICPECKNSITVGAAII